MREGASRLSGTVMITPAYVGFVGVLLLAGTYGVARAAEEPPARPRVLSLQAAKRYAWQYNPDLLSAQQDVEAALGQQHTAAQFPNPAFGFSSSKYKLYQENGTTLGNQVYNRSYDSVASVNELVELGGKRTFRRESAAAALAAARARLADARRQLDLSVTKAYLVALQAEGARAVAADSAASLHREAGIAATRYTAGDLSASDKDQIEIAAAQLDLTARTAVNAAVAARIALQVLLGIPRPDGEIHLAEPLDRLAELPLNVAGGTPPEERPDVVAARRASDQAAANVDLEKANRILDPTLQVQYEREPPDTRSSLGFAITAPLPLPGYNEGAVRAARAARRQAAVAADKARDAASADVATARAAYQEASARLRRYEETIRPEALRVRDSVTFSYEKGGANLLDLFQAQRAANDVLAATVQAQADRATAAAALAAALNLPFPAPSAPSAFHSPDHSKP
jgi:cobalt-zinc-cadmium efflux system outer membrane protein